MTFARLAGACALAATLMIGLAPSPAWADDPLDPAMRNQWARDRDRAIIRRLNQQQLAQVQQRDAGYSQGWQAYRDANGQTDSQGRGTYRAGAEYDNARADYDRRMAEWRHAVAACQAGEWGYCAR